VRYSKHDADLLLQYSELQLSLLYNNLCVSGYEQYNIAKTLVFNFHKKMVVTESVYWLGERVAEYERTNNITTNTLDDMIETIDPEFWKTMNPLMVINKNHDKYSIWQRLVIWFCLKTKTSFPHWIYNP
jgi:predicted nucleic acid-binding protein